MAMFCSEKEKVRITQKANMIYDIQCPACKNVILVKLIHVLLPALENMEVDMINQCSNTQLINKFPEQLSILNLPNSDNNIPEVELNLHIMNAVNQWTITIIGPNYVFWRLFVLKF